MIRSHSVKAFLDSVVSSSPNLLFVPSELLVCVCINTHIYTRQTHTHKHTHTHAHARVGKPGILHSVYFLNISSPFYNLNF